MPLSEQGKQQQIALSPHSPSAVPVHELLLGMARRRSTSIWRNSRQEVGGKPSAFFGALRMRQHKSWNASCEGCSYSETRVSVFRRHIVRAYSCHLFACPESVSAK